MKRFFSVLVLLSLSMIISSHSYAAWNYNGNVVAGAGGDQRYHQMIRSGSGGIVVWEDNRYGSYTDIYAQRYDSEGHMLWTENGVPVCLSGRPQIRPAMIADGFGGAFITWVDDRYGNGYDIFAQRIDSTGAPLWTTDGIPICIAPGEQHRPIIAPDSTGGAIITWHDARDGYNNIYAQRVFLDGTILWTENGVRVSRPHDGGSIPQEWPYVATDNFGGAFISWFARISAEYSEVWVQHVDAQGDTIWDGGGRLVATNAAGTQYWPFIIPDDKAGSIVTWISDIPGVNHDVMAQRLTHEGLPLWGPGGQVVATSINKVEYPMLASDEKHGAFIAWNDYKHSDPTMDLAPNGCIRRINASGAPMWDGKLYLWDRIKDNLFIYITPDGEGGVITAWRDDAYAGDIYAQKVDSTGYLMWGEDAETVCDTYNTQVGPHVQPDGSGGAFIAWADYRDEENYDIYASRVNPDHDPTEETYEPEIVSIVDVPGDQGGQLSVIWDHSDIDNDANRGIDHYEIWRRLSFETTNMLFVSPDSLRSPIPGLSKDPAKRPILKMDQAGFAWEWIADMPARFFDTYVATVPSLHDSTALGTGWQYFMVSAVTHDPYLFYDSEVDSGYSVDNLSPFAPTGLMASAVEGDLLLEWDPNSEADLLRYAVYKGDSEEFIPDAWNLIASPTVNQAIDTGWGTEYEFYYKVSAIDVHGNESGWSLITPGDVVATLLQLYSSSWSSGSIVLTWTVSSIDDGIIFHVSRSEDGGKTWQMIDDAEVNRDGMSFAFSDREILGGREYIHRVDIIDNGESRIFFVSEKVQTPEIPLILEQNYPNPFNPSTKIAFYLPEQTDISLSVYDVSGRLVRELERGSLGAGWHSLTWDGTSETGKTADSGAYFCRLKAGKDIITRKMILLR